MLNFRLERLLSNNTNRKTICLLGHFEDNAEHKAIVILEKLAFSDSEFPEVSIIFIIYVLD